MENGTKGTETRLLPRNDSWTIDSLDTVKPEGGEGKEKQGIRNLLLRRIIRPLSFLSISMPDVVFVFFIEFIISHGSTIHSPPENDSFI